MGCLSNVSLLHSYEITSYHILYACTMRLTMQLIDLRMRCPWLVLKKWNGTWIWDRPIHCLIVSMSRAGLIPSSIIASFDLLYHWTNLLRNVTGKTHYDLNTCQQLATQPLQTHRVSVVRDKSIASIANPRNGLSTNGMDRHEQTHVLPGPLLGSGVMGMLKVNLYRSVCLQCLARKSSTVDEW